MKHSAPWLMAAIVVAGSTLSGAVLAQSASETRQADPKRGATIAAQGTPSGAPGCAQCHAFNGASDGSGAFPRIAGQSAHYLAKELHDFGSGMRNNAVMSPIARAMTPDDIADVAAYYASLHAPVLPLPPPEPALVKKGEQLARFGNDEKRIQACNNCHGAGGTGEPPTIPYLAGQYSNYIATELKMWQRGYRKNSQNEMAAVSKLLSDDDIASVAAYYQQILGSGELANSQ